VLGTGAEHERLYRELIRRAGVAISSAESWVLWHVAARGPISAGALAARLELDPTVLSQPFEALRRRRYLETDPHGLPDLTAKGRHALVALIRAGQDEVSRLIGGREPAGRQGRTRAMHRLTRAALTTMPARA
jgi:DNA-binding MarR family transcriptional regulator